MTEKTPKSNKTLAAYERQIEKNIKAAWHQNGLILLKIRGEGLYKEGYGTFENYLEKRWDYGQSRGYQLVDAAEFAQKLAAKMSTIVDKKGSKSSTIVELLPARESHIRPLLTGLKTDSERVKVWENVTKDAKQEDRVITAEFVQKKVAEFVASGEVVEEIDFDELARQQAQQYAAKKSAPKPEPKPAQVVEQEPDEPSEHELLLARIDELTSEFEDYKATVLTGQLPENEAQSAAELIEQLRDQVKKLEGDLAAMTKNRDFYQQSAAEKQRLCLIYIKQIKRFEKENGRG